jgi:DNA polymerase III subunit delta
VQSLEELESDLRNELRPVYLVLGPETYLCRLALSLLKKYALSPGAEAFDYSQFAAGNASVAEIMEAAGTFPMLSKRRLVLVTDAEKLKDSEQDALLDSLPRLSPRSMLVLFAEELDHRRRFYKTLRERNCIAEFSQLKGAALEHWAEAFIRTQGYRTSSAIVKRIVDLTGADLQTLASELEKLMLASGKEKEISGRAIDDLVQASRQQGIFELIRAVGQRDRAGSLKSLANLLSMGEHPLVVVTMMARHCRQVLIAKEGLLRGDDARSIGSAAQIPPFILDQFLRQARAADSASIQEMYIRLAAIDKRLKSSSLDGRMMLENLICALV